MVNDILFLQFFNTEPYACDPSSLPKYPPTKEMDAKRRDDEARRSALFYLCSVNQASVCLPHFSCKLFNVDRMLHNACGPAFIVFHSPLSGLSKLKVLELVNE